MFTLSSNSRVKLCNAFFFNLLWQWQNLFFLGLYPVGKTAKGARTAVSRSGFKTISLPGHHVQIFQQHVLVKLRYSRGTCCQKLTNQNFAAAGGCRNEKMGVFVAGVPSSLAPSHQCLSHVLASLPLPRLRLRRRLLLLLCYKLKE